MRKIKRILVVVGIFLLLSVTYYRFFGVQTIAAIVTRYAFRKNPQASMIPAPLPDPSISNVAHKRLSRLGYEFELPWDDADEQKDKTNGAIHVTYFRSGNAFWFSTFPPRNLVSAIAKMQKLDPEGFKQVYGPDAFESDYNLHRILLEATPDQITPFITEKEAAVRQSLLMIKVVSMPNAQSGIFVIQSPSLKGFQFENPQTRPARITDELYDTDGGVDVMFLLKLDGSTPTISQPEINRVIQSIHRISPLEAESNTNH